MIWVSFEDVDEQERSPTALGGVLVLEVSHGLAARAAGSLLADLGADVVLFPADRPGPGSDDAAFAWADRRKVITGVGRAQTDGLAELRARADRADIVLSDMRPGWLERLGLDAVTVGEQNPSAVHVWMPPFGRRGRWSVLESDPLLLAAVTGYADYHPATRDRPVAPVVPTFMYLHGAMGAAAAVAGLVGRERSGAGSAACVTGVDALGAAMGTLMIRELEPKVTRSVGRGIPGAPHFRMYQAGDGAWFFLAALTPGIFIRALEAMGRLDLLARDDVAGEFSNILVPEVMAALNEEMEAVMAAEPAAYWLDLFRGADVPAAPAWSREEWLEAQIVPAAARYEFAHATLGTMKTPAPPINLSVTPMLNGGSSPQGPSEGWSTRPPWQDGVDPVEHGSFPLAGLKVVDICSMVAGPFVSSLLADFGADVVKVEPIDGDPYSVFAVSHAVVNQAKKLAAINLKDSGGRAAFLKVVAQADLLVDNFMPESLNRLGLTAGELLAANETLVRCSVSAFGNDNAWSDTPGFDPVLQSITGLAVAQGGTERPVQSSAPVVDVATGSLGALGALAALFVRCRSGRTQHVRTSLAEGAVYVQSGEMTSYRGRPQALSGGQDCLGYSATRRFYAAADGWVAVSASSVEARSEFFAAVGHPEWVDLSDSEVGKRLEESMFAGRTQRWVDELTVRGVPTAVALRRAVGIDDAYLRANGHLRTMTVPGIGPYRVVRSYSEWNGERVPPGRGPVGGRDTLEILHQAGVQQTIIDELLQRRVIAANP